MRIERNVNRTEPFEITVDGETLRAYPGETIATVMIERSAIFGQDALGEPRGLFCNMGTCSQCMVRLQPVGRPVRACMVTARPGMEISRG